MIHDKKMMPRRDGTNRKYGQWERGLVVDDYVRKMFP